MKHLIGLLIVAVSLTGAAGCLSSTHSIPQQDLIRLAQQDPAVRGKRVRVIQRFATSDEPPKAEVNEGNQARVDLHMHGGGGPRIRIQRAPRVPRVPRARPPRIHRGPSSHGSVHPRPGAQSTTRPAPKTVSKGKSSSGLFSLDGIDGEAAAVVAVVIVASAAAIAVALAGTEGARYDGWARLQDTHPVHLYGPDNLYKQVALKDLTVEDAGWARRAYVRRSEGDWQTLGRAPLNRRGWAYSVFLGAGQVGESGASDNAGPISHIQLGYFPGQNFGVHADLGFGWVTKDADNMATKFAARAALEAQFLPFHARRVHAGAFAQLGTSARNRAAGGGTSALYAGGVLMQLDLTTRLALTGRAGLSAAHNESASEISLGISIY